MSRCADVGELLFTAYIDRQIGFARVLADDHPFVHRFTRIDKEAPAFLQMKDRVTRGDALAVGNHRAVLTRLDRSTPRCVAVEDRMQHAGATRLGQKAPAKT